MKIEVVWSRRSGKRSEDDFKKALLIEWGYDQAIYVSRRLEVDREEAVQDFCTGLAMEKLI